MEPFDTLSSDRYWTLFLSTLVSISLLALVFIIGAAVSYRRKRSRDYVFDSGDLVRKMRAKEQKSPPGGEVIYMGDGVENLKIPREVRHGGKRRPS